MERSPTPVPPVFGDEAVDRALADWLGTNHLELTQAELLDTGGSGGMLVSGYLRELDDRRTGGMRIIKLVAPSPDAEAEPRNHRAALLSRVRDNEDFIDRHLVGLAEKAWRLGDSWVMIQHLAGNGQETATLASLGRVGHLPELTAQIVRGVLGGWNPEDPVIDDQLTAAAFVTELLGARLDDGSPLMTWVREHVDARAHDRLWFSPAVDGPVLPSPLALSAGSPLSERGVRFAARGRGHGDLHPGNIMVPVGADAVPEEYWLIDLSRFSYRALLARDPVHLLLCLVADAYLPYLSEEARTEVLTALSGPEPRCAGPLVPQGLAELIRTVRTEFSEWGAGRGAPAWRAQWFLSLQACALMFTARQRYPDRDRWWFYLLAAHACGAYLDSVGAPRPRSADVVESPGPAPGRPVEDTVAVAAVRRTQTVVAGPADARPAPAPEEAHGPDLVLAVLTAIWDAFEDPAEHVSEVTFSYLDPDVLQLAQHNAVRLNLHLGRAQMRSGTGAGGETDLDGVVTLLADVASAAAELRNILIRPMLRVQMLGLATQPRPKQQEDLRQALMALLSEVRRVSVRLSAPVP